MAETGAPFDVSSRVPCRDDRYVILEYLAEGGMGTVYRGKRVGLGGFEKPVVLKQLLSEFTERQEFIDLFLREARLTASFAHANIVAALDLVRAGSELFIVMELVEGADLRALERRARRRGGVLSVAAAVYIARETLAGLGYAHELVRPTGPRGIIHRDVSPQNILVSRDGEVKLTDFGIAKEAAHRSVFYRVRGKAGYMSPEQARGETLDARADLFSLAVILWELLAGERLFVPADITVGAEELYRREIPSLAARRPGVPRALDAVLGKALAVEPRHRFRSAAELSAALLQTLSRQDRRFRGRDLAAELARLCGPPGDWRKAVAASPGPPGTAVIEEDEPPLDPRKSDVSQLSNREMTSVLGPAPRAATLVPARRPGPFSLRAGVLAGAGVGLALAAVITALVPAPSRGPTHWLVDRHPLSPVTVAFESTPPGAHVFVEARERCTTPCSLELPAAVPTFIRLEADGLLPWTGLVDPAAPAVRARLRRRPPRSGQVVFYAPRPATVEQGGVVLGHVTTAGPLELPAGPAALTLRPHDGAPREVQVEIKTDGVELVPIDLLFQSRTLP